MSPGWEYSTVSCCPRTAQTFWHHPQLFKVLPALSGESDHLLSLQEVPASCLYPVSQDVDIVTEKTLNLS